ncbi:MAG: peptide chain release factor 2 [Chitinophagales bacterium]|nr:peptide chain release factor 2 [Chitinophagales bacterium]
MTNEQNRLLVERVNTLRRYLDYDNRVELIKDEEAKTLDSTFWNDQLAAQSLLKNIKMNKYWVDLFKVVENQMGELSIMKEFYELGEMTEDDVDEEYLKALTLVEELEFKSTLNGEEDSLGAIVEINAGAGGTESCDWASMLQRMYEMWGNKKGFKVRLLDQQDGDVAGIKSASIEIEGEFAYGLLKGENGVHRLVRISPFDSGGRRHTSFASVFIYPIVDDSIHIDINPSDLEWDVFRASGAGGQHVNRTESAVRCRHIPSGVVVECQQERSQIQNREKALQMLRSKLYELEVRKMNEERAKIEGSKMKIEWGSQIRNYVLHPYKLVKDNRTGFESSNPNQILDGDLDGFIKALLIHKED